MQSPVNRIAVLVDQHDHPGYYAASTLSRQESPQTVTRVVHDLLGCIAAKET